MSPMPSAHRPTTGPGSGRRVFSSDCNHEASSGTWHLRRIRHRPAVHRPATPASGSTRRPPSPSPRSSPRVWPRLMIAIGIPQRARRAGRTGIRNTPSATTRRPAVRRHRRQANTPSSTRSLRHVLTEIHDVRLQHAAAMRTVDDPKGRRIADHRRRRRGPPRPPPTASARSINPGWPPRASSQARHATSCGRSPGQITWA